MSRAADRRGGGAAAAPAQWRRCCLVCMAAAAPRAERVHTAGQGILWLSGTAGWVAAWLLLLFLHTPVDCPPLSVYVCLRSCSAALHVPPICLCTLPCNAGWVLFPSCYASCKAAGSRSCAPLWQWRSATWRATATCGSSWQRRAPSPRCRCCCRAPAVSRGRQRRAQSPTSLSIAVGRPGRRVGRQGGRFGLLSTFKAVQPLDRADRLGWPFYL